MDVTRVGAERHDPGVPRDRTGGKERRRGGLAHAHAPLDDARLDVVGEGRRVGAGGTGRVDHQVVTSVVERLLANARRVEKIRDHRGLVDHEDGCSRRDPEDVRDEARRRVQDVAARVQADLPDESVESLVNPVAAGRDAAGDATPHVEDFDVGMTA